MNYNWNILGALNVQGGVAGTDATITTVLIPPYPGNSGGGPFLYDPRNKEFGQAITHLTTLCYTNGDTAHVLQVMRPKNYGWLATALAANGTAFVPNDDPGVYSTNYRYPIPNAQVNCQVANNAIAANDWVAIQLNDGTWHTSKIASGTFGGGNLVLTTAVPNVTGGGAAVGNVFYFFGASGDKDPGTGWADLNTSVAAVATSGVHFNVWQETSCGFLTALHVGDPLLFYDPGTTHLGTLEFVAGFYAKS